MATLLCLAAAAGNVDRVEQLILKEGVAEDEADEDGITPLIAAARSGQMQVIHRLLRLGSPNLGAADKMGKTPLDHAVEAGRAEVVEYMLGDLSLLPFPYGLLPAIARADAQAVQAILTASDARLRGDVNERDARGAPALHGAVRTGSEAVVAAMLEQRELKVNRRDRYLRTAWDVACDAGQDSIALAIKMKGGLSGDSIEDFEDDDAQSSV